MTTLHGYILRDILRTFALTVVALATIITMGGGVYNVVRQEGLSGGDLFRILPFLLPVVITWTLPIAALFSTAIVYGRLAADNEWLACRAAGVNVHRLFLSAILLAIFVTLCTLLSENYIIPRFMQRVNSFARANLSTLAYEQLRLKGHVRYGNRYFLTAEDVADVEERELAAKGFAVGPDFKYLAVRRPTFLQLNSEGEAVRFTSADWGMCQFDTREIPIRITLFVKDGQEIELGRRATRIGQQEIGPIDVPLPFPQRPSWMDLNTLVRWLHEPWQAQQPGDAVRGFLRKYTAQRFAAGVVEQVQAGGPLLLVDESRERFTLTAARAEIKGDGRPVLHDAQMRVAREDRGDLRRYGAPQIELIIRPGMSEQDAGLEIRMLRTTERPVREFDLRSERLGRPVELPTTSIDRVQLPESLREELRGVSAADVISPQVQLPLDDRLADERVSVWATIDQFRRKIVAPIHGRLGYAISPLVTILMAAALGVIFRGARALSAFALSCIPFALVVVVVKAGEQLLEKKQTEAIGAPIIWGGLLLFALTNVLILRLGVRR